MTVHSLLRHRMEPGSVVALNSGGPLCLVRKIERNRVHVVWVDDGEVAYASFNMDGLTNLMRPQA